MLFQVLCGFEPIFYTTHSNEEPKNLKNLINLINLLLTPLFFKNCYAIIAHEKDQNSCQHILSKGISYEHKTATASESKKFHRKL